MKFKLLILWCLLASIFASAQRDSILITANYNNHRLTVKQKLIYYNKTSQNLHQIKLLNFVSSYKNRNTALLKRQLEDRKTDLYYAEKEQQGQLTDLSINGVPYTNKDQENIDVEIPVIAPNTSVTLQLEYTMQLPNATFTGYGTNNEEAYLKYFFIVPDTFDPENINHKSYLNINETANIDTFYRVTFVNTPFKIGSNLTEKEPNCFEGILKKDVEISLRKDENFSFKTILDGKTYETEITYPITETEKRFLEFYIPLHLNFILSRTGQLPNKIFISPNSKTKNTFLGNDDISFWKFNFKMFTDAEKVDLDYLSIIAQEVADQLFISNKTENHWITNGLKTYIEIKYLEQFYPNHKLLGQLPDYKFWGIKPLKYATIAKLKLTDRYSLPLQYIKAQNFDQKIDTPLNNLSNFNEFAVSKFETGNLFNFISEKMGDNYFDEFIKNYISTHQNTAILAKDFLDQLAICSGQSSAFLETYIQQKNRVNFSLQSFHIDQNVYIKVSKNTPLSIPFKLETKNENREKSFFLYDTPEGKNTSEYIIPDNNISKMIINDHYAFPETNYRDNYLYTKGIFSNSKKLKLKFFGGIPNPEYNEIYLAPKLAWNNYDKFLIGAKIQNKSLIDRPFTYSIVPLYSTGTNSLTGSFAISYKIQPAESFFRTLNLGLSTTYLHYNYNLAYTKHSVFGTLLFNKDPRSQINRNLVATYNYFERDLSPTMKQNNDYRKYNIWDFRYVYSETGIIKDHYIFGNLQIMEDYQKLSAESYYRIEYAKNKKISLRVFAGAFIENKTRNNTFDFGISKVSNYAFSYDLLAQSANSGILSQQFVIAEGGFKSQIKNTANQFIFATNIDSHLWKMFNVYADAGIYKNKNTPTEFIWDTGIKLKIIPDFLEIYFPIQSSLGFEPGFKDYKSRIRYTLNLNLGAAIGHFRKGWY